MSNNDVYLFNTIDKSDTLRWIEAIESATRQEPSQFLLQGSSGGTVVFAGFLTCSYYPSVTTNDPLKPAAAVKPGEGVRDVPVSYGKLWSVLKSSGLIQCMVDSKPVDIVNICENINKINVYKNDGGDYIIKITNDNDDLIMMADTASEHYDWVLNIENILLKNNISGLLVDHTNKDNSYVILKRLISSQNGREGIRGSVLISPSSESQVLNDLYSFDGGRVSPDGCDETSILELPPVPPRGSSAPPPPLPPRDPPPLPPKKGNSLQRIRSSSNNSYVSVTSSNGSIEVNDEYVLMQPSVPSSLKLTPSQSTTCSIPSPITEISPLGGAAADDYMKMNPVLSSHVNSRPIAIPGSVNRSSSSVGKRCVLLHSTGNSETDGGPSQFDVTPPLPPRTSSPRHVRCISKTPVVSRYHSMSNTGVSSRTRSNSSIAVSSSSYSSLTRTSNNNNKGVSMSECLSMREVKDKLAKGMTSSSYTESGSSIVSFESENLLNISGLSSSSPHSSIEDISQVSILIYYYYYYHYYYYYFNYSNHCLLDGKGDIHKNLNVTFISMLILVLASGIMRKYYF